MKSDLFKKLAPYLAAIFIFLALTFTYFSPLFQGKKLNQHDIVQWKGMSKEIVDYREKTGEEPLWTNSMFGGMPAWQISISYPYNLAAKSYSYIRSVLPSPADSFFLYLLSFFVLLLVLGVNPWVSLIGAIAFGFSTYFLIIFEAGHITKARAISFMPLVMAGIIWAYRGKVWKGSLLFAIALSFEIYSNHFQISYYLAYIILAYVIYRFILSVKGKTISDFVKTSLFLFVAGLIAISMNITNLWGTYEYSKFTMRGKPVLVKEGGNNQSGGLDRDYITAWSYGIGETWTFLIPNAKGGASGQIGNIEALKKADPAFRKIVSQQNAYWGDQPFTSGPVYIGAIVIFFFVLGMFIIKDRLKWVLFAVTVLSVLLSWGKNFMPLTDFFIDYIPLYNKFRTVSMILVIAELTIPLIAFMGLNEIIKNPDIIRQNVRAFYISLGLTGGMAFLFWLAPTIFFNFLSQNELQQFTMLKQSNNPAQIDAFIKSLENVRISIFQSDALRSFFFVAIAATLTWFYSTKKVSKTIFLVAIGMMVVADLYPVNKRYLNDDDFVRKSKVKIPFKETKADAFILKDKSLDYRVLDLTKNVFNDASPSYFHKNIGGYHAAKLQRYQDLIDYHLGPEIQNLKNVLQNNPADLEKTLEQSQVINMLNTKYIIYNPNVEPIINPYAFGNAWFVSQYKLVNNANEAIEAIGKVDLKNMAVIDKEFAGQIDNKIFNIDSTASIKLVSYAPDKLVYDYHGSKENMVIFSEIYYPKGWHVTIDGKEAPYFRVDYVLRGMVVPAGKHTIEFKFAPKAWTIGNIFELAASLIVSLMVIILVIRGITIKK